MSTELRRGTRRLVSREAGRETFHSFSFGPHYDPANLAHGPLVCHDEHRLEPGAGFPDHRHTDLEIVTWVVSGELVHDGTSVLRAGQVAVQSAGSGVVHSEVAGGEAVRFVQAWLRPDAVGGTPSREVAEVSYVDGALTPVAGEGSALPVGVAGATLAAGRLREGDAVTLPQAPLLHAFVVTGRLLGDDGALDAGDALRLTAEPGPTLTAAEDAELLVWTFHATV
ncbi:pirin family protein [Nocardioides euryhalodurans]|uniref:Pirin family protein n=1 Tax=Nocardioides euryhalodurans TaxID=2518370 RepID=A0A4P7GLZ8_9ACTN|nr:pirin family protein [Nocardioides euryhalodurans]QBR93023.1 pirin family protein [Nocardioides euryhalodurans]